MIHEFLNKQSKKTIILLHGTGGNEKDLLSIGQMIDNEANLLGIRGNVLENGMNRYFRRLAEGIFDLEDLHARTHELYEEIINLSKQYHFDLNETIGLGYSNGANILANLLFLYPNIIQKAILFHPMVPDRNVDMSNLSKTNVFISSGINDPICPKEESDDLVQLFQNREANVTLNWEITGHQLTYSEINKAKEWFLTFK